MKSMLSKYVTFPIPENRLRSKRYRPWPTFCRIVMPLYAFGKKYDAGVAPVVGPAAVVDAAAPVVVGLAVNDLAPSEVPARVWD